MKAGALLGSGAHCSPRPLPLETLTAAHEKSVGCGARVLGVKPAPRFVFGGDCGWSLIASGHGS